MRVHSSHTQAGLRALLVLGAALGLSACRLRSDDARFATDAGASPDLAIDVARGGDVALLGGCTVTAQCAIAPGVTCVGTFPAAFCSRHCAADDDCVMGAGTSSRRAACVSGLCLPQCLVGAGECAPYGGYCVERGQDDLDAVCLPSCQPAEGASPDAAVCGGGLVCDEYGGACVTARPEGRENGEPCRGDAECRGYCIVEGDDFGFIEGYCVSQARAPSEDEYRRGGPLPRSNCPAESAAFTLPVFGWEWALCYRACASDGDCRPGYACDRYLDTVTSPHTNGVCRPINCAQAGRTCPPGFECRRRDASTIAYCARVR